MYEINDEIERIEMEYRENIAIALTSMLPTITPIINANIRTLLKYEEGHVICAYGEEYSNIETIEGQNCLYIEDNNFKLVIVRIKDDYYLFDNKENDKFKKELSKFIKQKVDEMEATEILMEDLINIIKKMTVEERKEKERELNIKIKPVIHFKPKELRTLEALPATFDIWGDTKIVKQMEVLMINLQEHIKEEEL